jgi:hypothetical protein
VVESEPPEFTPDGIDSTKISSAGSALHYDLPPYYVPVFMFVQPAGFEKIG